MLPDPVLTEAESLLSACRDKGIMLATAESCTGGLIAAALTAIAGSSDVVDRGFITYSNEAKNEMIGVPMALIEAHGAVSEEVARAMADGADGTPMKISEVGEQVGRDASNLAVLFFGFIDDRVERSALVVGDVSQFFGEFVAK